MERKGYKVTRCDMTCRGFQFELGKTYNHNGIIKLCGSGFHFCLEVKDCFNYYSFSNNNRVFEITFGENVLHGDDKSVTDSVTFIRELSWQEVLEVVNLGKGNSGYRNSGNWNSGDRNSGDSNSGDRNSGNRNSGDSNSGNRNSGNRNSGNWNSGDWNSGNSNSGDSNSGYRNSGDSNSGDRNSGNWNSGYRNSGNWNSGDRNSGDSNSGYRNSGAFCTDTNPRLVLFDKPTTILIKDWENSEVVQLMYKMQQNIWVYYSEMTAQEKKDYPKAETCNGYLKIISKKEMWANFWYDLQDDKKALFTSLPNFNADKFEEITGIRVE